MIKLLASRSVYDQMLSIYKKFGQFAYNDTRDSKDDVVIEDGVREDKRKWVTVTATIKENINSVQTFRRILVFGDGIIREEEWNSKSSLRRKRSLLGNGECHITYIDEHVFAYGYRVVYFANGDVWRGELYKGKWQGPLEKNYADGRKEIGRCFKSKKIGNWRVIEKDGTERIEGYSG